jgi:hypothetical protein
MEQANIVYGNHSIEGKYWFRKVGGIPDQDALGGMLFDGKGNFSGTFVLNVKGTVTTMTYTGTYDVCADGSGTFTWVRDLPGGGKQTMHSHIVALRAEKGLFLELYSSLDAPDPESGELSGRLIVRQP